MDNISDPRSAPGHALTPTDTADTVPDYNPDEYRWVPVRRRPRLDGWTEEKQRRFIEVLADTGLVSEAAKAVDMSVSSAYRLRNAPGGESLDRAWTMATNAAAARLVDLAFSRAIEGQEEPVFDRDGIRVGARRRYNDRLMMFLLRAYHPDRFRPAHEDTRQPGEAPPPAAVPLAEAVKALAPVPPADPHLALPSERLGALVEDARALQELEERAPIDERERYRDEPVEPPHPAALERGRIRRQREAEREERRRERYGEPSLYDRPTPDPYGIEDL